MPSKTTTAIAARVPNDVARELRQEAEERGTTMSAVLSEHIRESLAIRRYHELGAQELAERLNADEISVTSEPVDGGLRLEKLLEAFDH
jgi:hypothetical protein